MNSNPANLSDAYDQWHAELDINPDASDPWHRLVKVHLNPEEDLAGKRVLEIGCGRGSFALWLMLQQPRPSEIVAADFSPTAVEMGRAYARKQGITGITWEVNDIQAIAHPDDSFDTVISSETIEHVPDPARAVSELRRVLKPGGRLFLTTPNYLGLMGLYRGYLRLRGRRYQEMGQPINNFTMLPQVSSWVRRAGLRIEIATAAGHYLPFPGRPWILFFPAFHGHCPKRPLVHRQKGLLREFLLLFICILDSNAKPAF